MKIQPIRSKWKSKMTDRERYAAQMHFKPVDRCYNMEFGYWDENFEQWDIFRKNGIKSNDDAEVFFNFDPYTAMGPRGFLNPPYEEKILEETATKYIKTNSDGAIVEVPKDGHNTIAHYIRSAVETPEDWKRMKEEHCRRDDPERKIDVEEFAKRHPRDRDYPIGVDCGSMIGRIRDILTFEGLAYACFDYPDMVEDMVETACQLTEDFLDHVLPLYPFDFACGWEDICFNKGPIVTVDFFKNVVTPRYKRIHKKLQQYGIDIWHIDCDGDVRPILPYLLEGGINCLFPFEVNSCSHPGALLDEYQGVLRIMGGVDKMQLGAGRDAIKKYMYSLVPYVERGGFIPFCDHRCPPNVPEEDYLYYLDLKEELFGLKED